MAINSIPNNPEAGHLLQHYRFRQLESPVNSWLAHLALLNWPTSVSSDGRPCHLYLIRSTMESI